MTGETGPYLFIDPDKCTGCHSCEMACAVAHTGSGSLFNALLNHEALTPRNRVLQIGEVKMTTQCRQCEDAPCVKVCPTGATYQTSTYTAVNPNLCIACKLCMMVCPFGAIKITNFQENEQTKRVAMKCDLCIGRPGGPACVEACPTHAISIMHPKEVQEAAIHASAERYLAAVKAQAKISQQP